MVLNERSKKNLLRRLSPRLAEEHGMPDDMWLNNRNEVHVSVILVLHESQIQVELLRQSSRLLDKGVFNAAIGCLWEYDHLRFLAEAQQGVQGAKSMVDFYVLVDGEVVALVEAKSPSVMNMLHELLPEHGFELKWTNGSTNLVSLIFLKVSI
jgi:hypothetical protein